MYKKITTSVIAILIIGGAVTSLFLEVNPASEQIIRAAAFIVIGFYFGGTPTGTKLAEGLTLRKI